MRELKLLIWNAIFAALIYYGIFEKIDGAYNVLVFVICLMFVIGLAMKSEQGQKSMIESKITRSKISIVYRYTDMIAAGILVWFGHWFLGILVILTDIFIESGWDEIQNAQESAKSGE